MGDNIRYYHIKGESYPSVTSILEIIAKPGLIRWAAETEFENMLEASADLYESAKLAQPMERGTWITSLRARAGAVRAHTKKTEAAANLGSTVHHMIEAWLRKRLLGKEGKDMVRFDTPVPVASAFTSFVEWFEDSKLKPLFMECTVFSKELHYAGTLDFVAQDENGHGVIVDFKTGNRLYHEHSIQVSAYAKAVDEMKQGPVTKGFILRLPRTQQEFEDMRTQYGRPFELKDVQLAESFAAFILARHLWQWKQDREKLGRSLVAEAKGEVMRLWEESVKEKTA